MALGFAQTTQNNKNCTKSASAPDPAGFGEGSCDTLCAKGVKSTRLRGYRFLALPKSWTQNRHKKAMIEYDFCYGNASPTALDCLIPGVRGYGLCVWCVLPFLQFMAGSEPVGLARCENVSAQISPFVQLCDW